MTYDLILRGGRVVDPSQKLDAVTDVAFAQGKVARIGTALRPDATTDVRDVSGAIVTPGLIDLHTHVYWGGTSLGIDAEDFCRRSGVTTAIDTGSAGPGNFAGFRRHVIEKSEVRILAFLHVSFAGIYAFSPRRNGGRERGNPSAGAARCGRGRGRQPGHRRRHQGAGRRPCFGPLRHGAARYRFAGRR